MRSKEKIAEEIVLIRYYNVLFYLFFKTGMDDFKRQCLIKKIDDGESMRMREEQTQAGQWNLRLQNIRKIFWSDMVFLQ